MPGFPCTFHGCVAQFRTHKGRTYHFRTFHKNNNLVEEIDIQANPAVYPGGLGGDDIEMCNDLPHENQQPAPQHVNEAPQQPTVKAHPYLSGESVVLPVVIDH